jgi:hypothetical protein
MTLEGALGPNDRLEAAAGMPAEAPDALCLGGARLLFSSGRAVLALARWGEAAQVWAEFNSEVTALFASPGGLVAAGLAGGTVDVRDAAGRPVDGWTSPSGLASVVDGLFLSEVEFVVVDSGYRAEEPLFSMAPWDDAARGRLISVRRGGEARKLAGDLWCPMGVCRDPKGALVVTEFERARVIEPGGAVRQAGLPGYLGRLRRTPDGYALACLSRRDPLIEFLKTERAFVADMKASVPPSHWIAPRANPEFAHDVPIELGAARLFGAIKPWAPSFSYGLLIELDETLAPVRAAHSRANGRRHAISDALVFNSDLIAVSKASGELLNLGPLS